MIPEQPNNLPIRLLRELKSNSESFVIIHFNKDGLPLINIHAPTIKDFLALERLVMDYAGGLPIPDEINGHGGLEGGPEDEEEDGRDSGESWKDNL
jgi:hypothetical protein